MVIRSFKDEDTELFFRKGILPRKKGWTGAHRVIIRKLDMLNYAKELKDLRSPPGNKLEGLVGDLNGHYSVRINDQWRVVFKWDKQPYDVHIVDYH